MKSFDELEICKESYYRELDRKSSLTNSLALPIGISTVIAGGYAYVVTAVANITTRFEITIACLSTLAGFCLLAAVYFICRSYLGYTYKHMPTVFEMREYRRNLVNFHNEKENAQECADAETMEYYIDKLASTAHDNTRNNDAKSGYLYLANRSLVVSLGFLLLAAIPLSLKGFDLSWSTLIDIMGHKCNDK